MSNTYRKDDDLSFLRYADNDMLEILVKYLTTDKDGSTRYAESLTDDDEFKAAKGDYKKVWEKIAGELQHFGGDSVVNLFRGTGVKYKEILTDVCKKINVKTDFTAKTIKIEQALLAKLIEKSWEEMSEQEQDDLRKELNIDPSLSSISALFAIINSINLGGKVAYTISLIVAQSVSAALLGRSVVIIANGGLGRLAGPIGLAITALLTIPMLTGPAYRVTLPSVIQVAAMRQQMRNKKETRF